MEDLGDIISLLFFIFFIGATVLKSFFGDSKDESPEDVSPAQNDSSDFDEARKMVEEIKRRRSPVYVDFEQPQVVLEEEDFFADTEAEAPIEPVQTLARDYYAELKAIQESEAYQKSVDIADVDASLDESVEVKLAAEYDFNLKTPKGLRAAIVASEIISKPLALRSDW